MEVLVHPVSHWIGYHIAERLLHEGYEVKGIKGEDDNNHLIDFFQRNSNFELMTTSNQRKYQLAIFVEDIPEMDENRFERMLQINGERSSVKNATYIDAPYLFGEWMPMTEEGIYVGENYIGFSSPAFLEKGVYITDFLSQLLQWLKDMPAYQEIRVESVRNQSLKGKKLEKTFSVEENIPIKENINQVLAHFRKFQALYPAVNKKT